MNSKPYPRSPVTREPSPACKRMIDTNVLIDFLYEDQLRYAVVKPWFRRLLNSAPKNRILIPDAVLDEYMHATLNSHLLRGGEVRASARQAISALKSVLRCRSVRVVPNASPQPGRFHNAVLRMREAPRRRAVTDLRIAFTAVQHRALLCTADVKDFGAIGEALPGLRFYDPAGVEEDCR